MVMSEERGWSCLRREDGHVCGEGMFMSVERG